MTDLKRLRKFLHKAEIEYTEYKFPPRCPERVRIVCREGNSGVSGYNGFYTDFEFTIEGKFITMGAYE